MSVIVGNLKNVGNSKDCSVQGRQSQTDQIRKGEYNIQIGNISCAPTEIKSEPQVVEMTPQDEVLLTYLGLDNRDLTVYDITSNITMAGQTRAHTAFKCFFETQKKILLTILDIAEELGAQRVYACLKKKSLDSASLSERLQFVGFNELTEQQTLEVSRTKTHNLMCYDLNEVEI